MPKRPPFDPREILQIAIDKRGTIGTIGTHVGSAPLHRSGVRVRRAARRTNRVTMDLTHPRGCVPLTRQPIEGVDPADLCGEEPLREGALKAISMSRPNSASLAARHARQPIERHKRYPVKQTPVGTV